MAHAFFIPVVFRLAGPAPPRRRGRSNHLALRRSQHDRGPAWCGYCSSSSSSSSSANSGSSSGSSSSRPGQVVAALKRFYCVAPRSKVSANEIQKHSEMYCTL